MFVNYVSSLNQWDDKEGKKNRATTHISTMDAISSGFSTACSFQASESSTLEKLNISITRHYKTTVIITACDQSNSLINN